MKTQRQMHKCLVVFLLLPLILHGQGHGVAGLNGAVKPGNRLNTGNFEENRGQIRDQYGRSRPDVLFSGNTGGMVYHISSKGISYQLNKVDSWQEEPGRPGMPGKAGAEGRMVPDGISTYRVDLNWLNANYSPKIQKGEALPGYTNYYNVPNGVEPALNVQQYADITFRDVWNGVDLHYYSKDGILESDWLVQWALDYQQIVFEVSGAELSIAEDGWLVMQTPFGEIREGRLRVYQKDKLIRSEWKVEGNRVSFDLFDYDKDLPLRIDPPVRIWGTLYGGNLEDYGYSCAVDAGGNVYMAGTTKSTNLLATTGAHQTTHGNPFFPYGSSYSYDGYLVKFNPDGIRLWGTYYGGDSADWVYSCAVDRSKEDGEVYIAGTTMSSNAISTLNAHQDTFGGNYDAFLVKFNHLGIRQWGTYYGGNLIDAGYSCTVDQSSNVLLAGFSYSTSGIATEDSHQPTFNGSGYSALLVKFFSNGIRQWGTYYGESDYGGCGTWGYSCKTDLSGNIFLCGSTNSSYLISTPGALQTARAGLWDAFLVKFNSNGVRQWGTYYGGNMDDDGFSCSIDLSGNVYLAGHTRSTYNIATPGAHNVTISNRNRDAYLVKFNSNGVRQWGTYYGGYLSYESDFEFCTVDPSGNVYLLGYTDLTTGIATPGTFQDTWSNAGMGFWVKFNTNGVRDWGTYIRGFAESCVMDPFGNLYLSGRSNEVFMSTPGSYQSSMGGPCDAFLVRFSECSNYLNLSVQPQDQQVITGQQAKFIVSTSNTSATYQWQTDTGNGFQNLADTGQYSSATTDTLTITNVGFGNQNQMFRCIVTALPCTDTSDTATLTVVTGIDEPMDKALFFVYPNPAHDYFIIQSESNITDGTYTLLDLYGRTLVNGKMLSNRVRVDVSHLPGGICYLVIRNTSGQIYATFKVALP